MLADLRLILALTAMLTLPGWAALSVTGSWRRWQGLQRWIVAVSISIALYPALFYILRSVLPSLVLGPYHIGGLLLVCAAVVGVRMRKHWRELLAFDQLEWIAIAIFCLTLLTRLWIIHDYLYPAWSDSLHHTLLTQLTAEQGQLPATLEPYFPIPLGQYHLGLYALSATVQWLGQVPAHTALLWTTQTLNGLCGLCVYLVLDRKVGRLGAVVGAATVGLLSHQPAFYVNWGRFTQLAGQTIFLAAWLLTWEAISLWQRQWKEHRSDILWHTGNAALLTAAVFLLHFRVAVFLLPLLAISVTWELWKARGKGHQIRSILIGTAAIGILALAIATPALWEAGRTYVASKLDKPIASGTPETMRTYYEFPWYSVPYLVARPWLLGVAGICTVIAVLKRNKLTIACLLWGVALYVLGMAYVLGVPLLAVTNMGAILLIFYLPIGLIAGAAAEELLPVIKPHWHERGVRLIVGAVVVAGLIGGYGRITAIEPFRYFVTPEDVAAMDWIRENTPEDARFAVNTYFWLPKAPHGTDAGYWIPYFTNRQTTGGVMLFHLGAQSFINEIVEMSQAAERLEIDNTSLPELQTLGIDYIYIGQRGDFSGPGLDAAKIIQSGSAHIVYENDRVFILQITSPETGD